MAVAPGYVASDHRVLLVVAAVVRAVEGEVAQCPEVALDAVQERSVRGHVGELDVIGGRPVPHPAVFFCRQVRAEIVEHDGDAHPGRVKHRR